MEEMRLQKYLALCNVASRRASEEMILQGRICINGERCTVLGTKVAPGDRVTVDGESVCPETKKYYIMLNKPVGYVTTVSDDQGRPTVMELVSDISKRVYPVGRLDFNTEGLLLMTNDGDFTYKLTHPKHGLEKTYHVWVSGKAEKNALHKLEQGVYIDGRKTSPAKVDILDHSKASAVLSITIHEGRNRQVRKMCASVGFRVMGLKRVSEGGLLLGNLPLGKWRHLTDTEIKRILKNADTTN